MSQLIRTMNLIKTHRSVEWLTPSQQRALLELEKSLRIPGTVNLSGATGVGKTFLAWILADKLGYAYFPHSECFSMTGRIETPGVIIDNNASDRRFHRNVLKTLQFTDIRYAVLITRQPFRDYTYLVELDLSQKDLEAARTNLSAIGLSLRSVEVTSLWDLINPYLRRH